MRSAQLDQPFRHQALHHGSDEQFVGEIESLLRQEAISGDAKGREAGVTEQRLPDAVLTASEIAVNSILYSGGGEMLLWRETDRFLCVFRDKGTIEDPLVGRFRPALRDRRGRGIWLAYQLADLVQLRSGQAGTVIRLSFNVSA